MDQPSLSFRDAAHKIVWANHNIQNLATGIQAWLNTKPCYVIVETNGETRGDALKVILRQPIPVNFLLMAGDICGNMRAALDFAWMGLIRSANPVDPEKRTMPITDNVKGLEATINKAPIGPTVPQATRLLRDQIRSHRDFANGGNKALAALNELSNWNKHNMLLFNVGCTTVVDSVVTNDSGGSFRFLNNRFIGNPGSFISIGDAPSNSKINHNAEPAFQVLFGAHPFVFGEPVIPTLLNFSQICTQAIQAFCKAFPDPENPQFR